MTTKQDNMTPMMRQFHDLKQKHPDAILLFRCGDFYETYEDDAKTVSKLLGITLTKRTSSPKGEGYMAGFPHHALDTYLPRLIRAGKRVAICDQLEPPKPTKKYSITELVTPNNQNNNPLNHQTTMKLNINANNTESKNQVNNTAIQPAQPKHPVTPIEDAVVVEESTPKATKVPKTQPAAPVIPSAVQLTTYKTKRGDTAPMIYGFAGEDDPRWRSHKDADHKYVAASYRRDINGEKVYILLFGTRYMDVAKALAGAYNSGDPAAWHRAEDACMAIYEQAQREGKAKWEAKKAEWKAKADAKKAEKSKPHTYTAKDVADMMNKLLAGGDVPAEIKKMLAA